MSRVILTQNSNQVFWESIGIDKHKRYRCELVSASIDNILAEDSNFDYAIGLSNNSGSLHDVSTFFTNDTIAREISFETNHVTTKNNIIEVNPRFFNDYSINIKLFKRDRTSTVFYEYEPEANDYRTLIELKFKCVD